MLGVVIAVGQVEFRSTGAVDPFSEEAIVVDVGSFLDGCDEIGGDYVLAAVDFEIVLYAAPEMFLADLMTEHVENEPGFFVGVSVKLIGSGIVEIEAHDGFVEEVGLPEPFAGGVPAV